MAKIRAVDFERCGMGRGIRTAALVLVLTAGAVTADHLFFVAPSAHPVKDAVAVKADLPATAAIDGFKVPEHLRPTQADVVTDAPAF